MITQITILTLILSGISTCNSYRILAVFPFHGRSHFHVLEPIAKALASKGHQVDVMSNFKLKEPFPNYTDLEFPTEETHASIEFKMTTSGELVHDMLFEFENRICSYLGHPKIAKLIKDPPKDPPYDAVLVHMLTGYQCFNAIGHIWDVPVIGVVTTAPYINFQQFIGNPLSLSIASAHVDYYRQNLTFFERVYNVVRSYQYSWADSNYRLRQEPLLKKYFGSDIPSGRELEKNLALLFTNSHYSFHGIKPKTPALIEIGGINIKNDSSTIDPSLKKLLDKSNSDFIYFSFGSLTILESLPPSILENLYKVFRKISPIKVIMRAENPDVILTNLSDNVHVFDWLPQQKILEHPNIKAFVTHGGGLSSPEAIHYAVPVICIPLFAEQMVNCDIFSLKNMGVKIDVKIAQQRDYEDTFQEILSNPKYKDSMKKFSQLYWDRPQSPQETVNYWVEYVIRHGKNVLRSPALDLEWWQFDLIDVYFFLFSCFILSIILALTSISYTIRLSIRLYTLVNIIKTTKKINKIE